MKPSTPHSLLFVFSVSGCETARYPNHLEFFAGQAFIMVDQATVPPILQSYLYSLTLPVNEGWYCTAPTTDATVQAVNDYIRTGRRLAPHELYSQETFYKDFFFAAVGSYRPDIAGTVLFDSAGRMVTVGLASRDFDGNYFELPDEDYDEVSTIDRLIDFDSVWRKCEEQWSVFRSLPPL
jgi:hypothetical protein